MNDDKRDFAKRIKSAKGEATKPVREVMEHLYQGILALPEFTLKDGTKAKLDPLVGPEVNDDGDIEFGFDVLLNNGSHLEFMVTNTGWGRPFTPNLTRGKSGKPPGR